MSAIPIDVAYFTRSLAKPLKYAGADAWYRVDVTGPGKLHVLTSKMPSGLNTAPREVPDEQIKSSICFPGYALAQLLHDIMVLRFSGSVATWTLETFDNEPVLEIVATCGCGEEHKTQLVLSGLDPTHPHFFDPSQN